MVGHKVPIQGPLSFNHADRPAFLGLARHRGTHLRTAAWPEWCVRPVGLELDLAGPFLSPLAWLCARMVAVRIHPELHRDHFHTLGDRTRVDFRHFSFCRALVDSADGLPGIRRGSGSALARRLRL